MNMAQSKINSHLLPPKSRWERCKSFVPNDLTNLTTYITLCSMSYRYICRVHIIILARKVQTSFEVGRWEELFCANTIVLY
jgi:hypothetical protein